jgi:hypothetical protein
MPDHAGLAVLALLGTGLTLALVFLGLVFAVATRRRVLAKWLTRAGLAGVCAYAAALLAFSFTSRDENLRKGDRKYFCEIDCHLAYSIEEASRARVLGTPPLTAAAAGSFSIVTIRTWFDPETIASFRGNGPLTPNPRQVFLVDDSGRRYGVSPAGQKAFEDSHGPTAPLTRILRPGESYTTTLVFDVPPGARMLRLFLGDPPGIETLLLGHENSPFHRKIYFDLPPG